MNQKRNKGITLIALVITIIVLLILAGVTINMVLGDDGIIAQAEGATDAYEKESANEDRQIKSTSFEMDMITLEKNGSQEGDDSQAKSEIKTGYGMLTGIMPKISDANTGTMVSDLKKTLPKGYDILKEDGSAIIDDETTTDVNEATDTLVGTGMQVVKNGKIVLRIVVYGDVNGDGNCTSSDYTAIQLHLKNREITLEEYYQKEAADVTHNKIIDEEDVNILTSIIKNKQEIEINVIPNNPNEIVVNIQ